MPDAPTFIEDWYPNAQLRVLADAYEPVHELKGAVVEIGCWEGKSTIALARACYPETLMAVDTWEGSQSEYDDPADPTYTQVHFTVKALRERDVYATFMENIRRGTRGNVQVYRMSSERFLDVSFLGLLTRIKFIHIDGAHDYAHVRADIDGALRVIAPGGIICGDDFQSVPVSKAVRECLPGVTNDGRFWCWRAPSEAEARP